MYEFNVQIWHEEGEWRYSLIQEFRHRNIDTVEPLAYGTCDSLEQAVHCVSVEMQGVRFEG